MKALSIRQPEIELLLQSRTTWVLRTWQVRYRGPLLLHASARRRLRAIRAHGFDPAKLIYGALVGVAELVEIISVDAAHYEALRAEHPLTRPYPGPPLFAWRLTRPQRLPKPIPWPGRPGLFSVPDDVIPSSVRPHPIPAPPPDESRPFVLYTFPAEDYGYRIELYQWAHPRLASTDEHRPWWRIALTGPALHVVGEAVASLLRQVGYAPADLWRRLGKPLFLPEPLGVRLALLFFVAKPLKRFDRLEAITAGIARMSDEEAYYWFSKCSPGPEAERGRRALRVLLAG